MSSPESELALWRENARNRFDAFSTGRSEHFIALAALLLLYLAVTALSGSRELWHDELYTYYIAKAPSLARLFRELQLDLNPPLEYLSVRASLSVFGDSAYATRLPSIIAFLVGSLCYYRFISKQLGWMYGVLVVLVWWSTPFLIYSTEARPYALVVGWFGIAMLAWEQASKTGRSKASVLLLAAAVTGMMLSHIFSLLYIQPFCLVEAWRLYRTRRFDWALGGALLIPAMIPFAFVKFMARFRSSLFPTVFAASPRRLAAFYYHILSPEALALAIAVAAALALGFRSKSLRTNSAKIITSTDIIFTAGLLLLPELVILALIKTHGAFFPRYAILFGLGLAFLVVFGVAQLTDTSRLAAGVACCVLFLYDTGAIVSAYKAFQIEKAWPAKQAAMLRTRPDLPIAATNGVTFLQMSQYASPAMAQRLYYLTDRDLAIRYAHATMFQDLGSLKRYFPIHATVQPYWQFVGQHSQFLVFGSAEWPEDWLIRCLRDQHANVQPVGSFVGPYKDFELFQVTMPSSQREPGPQR